jgi:hypothetical protein
MNPATAADAASDTPDGTPTPPPAGDSQQQDQGTTPTTTGPDDSADKDWKSEAEKWKALARKHENANASSLKELEQLRSAQMTDSEKAIAEAEKRGRDAALASMRTEVAEARLRAAAAGKVADVDALVDVVDLGKFVTDDGVDSSAIEAAVERFIKVIPPAQQPKFGNADLGPQGNRPRQLTRDDLRTMTPTQIEDARVKGQLDTLLGISP